MKKYTSPELELVKYEVNECLGASEEAKKNGEDNWEINPGNWTDSII